MSKRDQIINLIQQVSGKTETPTPEQSLFESGIMDSFALPDLVSALETAFSLSIPDADLVPRKFETIERIEAYLDARGA